MCDIKLTIENDGRDLIMTVTSMEGQPKTTLTKLNKAFESSDYSKFLLIDGAIELLLEELSQLSEKEETEEEECMAVSKAIANTVDASLSVSLGPENMSAKLVLTAGYGGRDISNSDVIELLKENNITKGIIKNNLINLVKQGAQLPGGKDISTEIAVGKSSSNGKDGYIKYLVGDPVDRILRPKKLENGNVDMRELGSLVYVQKDTKLAKLMPPTDGCEGFTVTGDIIEATPGQECLLEESEGSSFLAETKNILIANINGMPKHLDNSVTVNTVLEIENIDVSTGNISFDGSIYVQRNVCEGMKLSASEDIVIGGIVESAQIASGGNISIAQGIIGRQLMEDDELINSTTLQAKGDVSAQFVQYADIIAENDITIVQYISHSQIIVEGDLWVGNTEKEKADGKLFGTFVQAGGSVYVGVLGSPCGAMTNLNLNYWADTITELRKNAKANTKKVVRRTNKIYYFLANIHSQENVQVEKIERINNALKQHLVLLGKLNKIWLEREVKVNVHLDELEISAYQSILSGVDITVSSGTCTFKRDYEATKIQWFENKMSVEPIVS